MDKFNNIPLSADEHNDLFSFDREALENFHWVSIAKSKGLEENFEVMMIASHTLLFHHTEVQKVISLGRNP